LSHKKMDISKLLVVLAIGVFIIVVTLLLGLSPPKRKPRVRSGTTIPRQEIQPPLAGGMVENSEMERLIEGIEKLNKQVSTVNKNLLVIGVLVLIPLLLAIPACPVKIG
jgi:hypothetical protein